MKCLRNQKKKNLEEAGILQKKESRPTSGVFYSTLNASWGDFKGKIVLQGFGFMAGYLSWEQEKITLKYSGSPKIFHPNAVLEKMIKFIFVSVLLCCFFPQEECQVPVSSFKFAVFKPVFMCPGSQKCGCAI